MDRKKISKSISRFFAWFGLVLCSLIIRCVPSRLLYSFARKISSLGYFLAARQRKLALESLAIAFGSEKPQKEIEKIAKESFVTMAKSALEVIFLLDKPHMLQSRVWLEGEENLKNALSKGRGVILVSAHFGNFPLLLARLSQLGYSASGIMRPMRDAKVEKIFQQKRSRYGVKTIYSQPRDICVNQTIESLRNNEIVFIPLDQNFGTAGVFVDFFGIKAATATGPVVLAQRTHAALLPCFIVRQEDDTHKIIFEKEVGLKEAPDSRETIRVNIQRLTDIIELYIRRYPAQWGWVHRRWKSRPN